MNITRARMVYSPILVAILAIGMLVAVSAVREATAGADTGGYPYWNMPCEHAPYATTGSGYWCVDYDWGPTHTTKYNDPSEISPYGYAYRNCTDFVAWKLATLGVPSSKYEGLGNADTWPTQAPAKGVAVNGSPAVGSVAVSTSGEYGHVAFVTAVNGQSRSSITVAQYNYNEDGNYTVQSGTPEGLGFSYFVHFEQLEAGGGGSTSSNGSGAASFAPVPIIDNGGLDVMAIGTNGHAYQFARNPVTFKWNLYDLSSASGNGTSLTGTPSAIYLSEGLDVLATGTNGHLYQFNRNQSSWKWTSYDLTSNVGGATVQGNPVPIVDNGGLDVMAIGTNGHAYQFARNPVTFKWNLYDPSAYVGGQQVG